MVDDNASGSSFNFIEFGPAKSQGEADILALKALLLVAVQEKGVSVTDLSVISSSKVLDTVFHKKGHLNWELRFERNLFLTSQGMFQNVLFCYYPKALSKVQ